MNLLNDSWFEQHRELPVLLGPRLHFSLSFLLSVLQNDVAPPIVLPVEFFISGQLLAYVLQGNILWSNLDCICFDEVVVVKATVVRLRSLNSNVILAC